MQKKFYISHNGNHAGPYSFDEVLERLDSGDCQWSEYIFDEEAHDWMLLLEHPEFTNKFNSGFARQNVQPILLTNEVKIPQSQDLEGKYKEKAWYLLKDGNNFGPFSAFEVIDKLQKKEIYEYEFAWQAGMSAWKRIAEIAEFSPENMRQLLKSSHAEVSEVFFRRRHVRAKYGCSLIVHNSKNVYKGHSLEISAGGAGILVENAELEPGQGLFLHFQPGDGVPPFNAVCNIVSKQFSADSLLPNTYVRYGVQFTSISQVIRESIRDYTEKKKAA